MACINATMVGLAMNRKPWASHAGVQHHLSMKSRANLANLTHPDLPLVVLTFVALLVLFLAKVAILGLVHCPFHITHLNHSLILQSSHIIMECGIWNALKVSLKQDGVDIIH